MFIKSCGIVSKPTKVMKSAHNNGQAASSGTSCVPNVVGHACTALSHIKETSHATNKRIETRNRTFLVVMLR